MADRRLGLGMRPGGGPGGGGGRMNIYLGAKEKPADAWKTLGRLWKYLSRRKLALFVIFLMVLVSSALTLTGPLLLGMSVDAMIKGFHQVDFTRLVRLVFILLAVYAAGGIATWVQTWMVIGISQKTVKDIRDDLFAKLQTLSLRFFDSKTHGELMSRLTNDVENVNTTLSQSITQLFSSAITVTGSLAMMLVLNPLLTLLALVTIPLGIWITAVITNRSRTYFSGQQKELGNINGFIEETVSGQRVVKSFRREKEVIGQFDAINDRLKKVGVKAQISSGLIPPLMNLLNNVSFAIVAGAGGWLAITGKITVGVIASFLNYSRQFARPINDISNLVNMIQAAIAGAERVFEIMDQPPEIVADPSDYDLKDPRGDVELRNVDFSYVSGTPVLKKINLSAFPGKAVALVGPTGAGKTTIVNLLARFYDIDGGEILIDGHDIRSLRKDSLRKALGIVLQDTYLFSASVRENIRYGRLDANDEEVEAAAKMAEADPFIRRLPRGYETVLSEDGANLSQGQRQLITIARAILADPAVLVLDEATSSVDTRTELHIQNAMMSLMKGRTSFVIAHRLSTIREASEIIVIDHGEIVERGTHPELLAAKGFYFNLYNAQLRREAEMRESVSLG